MIRSGRMKSSTAAPSLRNSGFEAVATRSFDAALLEFGLRSPCAPASVVPTGTVDLTINSALRCSLRPSSRAQLSTWREVRRAVLARRRTDRDEDHRGMRDRVVVARGELQAAGGDATRDHLVQPGFMNRDLARRCRRATFAASTSMQRTSLPTSARQAPVTSPTYPVPMTVSFILWFWLALNGHERGFSQLSCPSVAHPFERSKSSPRRRPGPKSTPADWAPACAGATADYDAGADVGA